MTERECLAKMKAPGDRREGIWRGGVLQVWVTRACDRACFHCTQGSNLRGKPGVMTVEQYATALESLRGYFGVVGMFGGNPAIHPDFPELCLTLAGKVAPEQRGLWCNNPITAANAQVMRRTFNPAVSNLNVHEDAKAYQMFWDHWPESRPYLKGLTGDSRHGPPFVAMRDVVTVKCGCCDGTGLNPDADEDDACGWCNGTGTTPDEDAIYDLVSTCDVNQRWSALIGVFRGQLRAWFCELAGAQAMLHQHEADYPDTGLDPTRVVDDGVYGSRLWWQLGMESFTNQVRKHCFDCGMPLRSYGALANGGPGEREQVSATHSAVYLPKERGRRVELVTVRSQLAEGALPRATDYIENARE